MKPKSKWRFAIGTTSRVPDSGGLHYLIADFDGTVPDRTMDKLDRLCVKHAIWQRTEHGWHLYTDKVCRFDKLVCFLVYLRADPAWIDIGNDRGYFFLADKDMLIFPWRVEHMVIHHGKEKTRNTETS